VSDIQDDKRVASSMSSWVEGAKHPKSKDPCTNCWMFRLRSTWQGWILHFFQG